MVITDEQIGELLDEVYEIGLAKPDEQIEAVRQWVHGLLRGDPVQQGVQVAMPIQITTTCMICKLDLSAPTSYVCPHPRCPTQQRVTS